MSDEDEDEDEEAEGKLKIDEQTPLYYAIHIPYNIYHLLSLNLYNKPNTDKSPGRSTCSLRSGMMIFSIPSLPGYPSTQEQLPVYKVVSYHLFTITLSNSQPQ